jgi:hypothetical protein
MISHFLAALLVVGWYLYMDLKYSRSRLQMMKSATTPPSLTLLTQRPNFWGPGQRYSPLEPREGLLNCPQTRGEVDEGNNCHAVGISTASCNIVTQAHSEHPSITICQLRGETGVTPSLKLSRPLQYPVLSCPVSEQSCRA